MNFYLDTHTHTLASGHAYSTVSEMINAAKEKGLSLLAITEHAPKMPGTCHEFYFHNFRVFKNKDFGIELLLGSELNILDFDGHVDLDENTLKSLDLCIASLHLPCYEPGTKEQNTNAYINAMKNPYIHIIGHPDDGRIPVDYEKLVKTAKENHIALELNNSSLNPLSFRPNAKENDLVYLELCKTYQVPISLGSDAHICYDVANFTYAASVLKQVNFPEELILNTSLERFKQYMEERKKFIKSI
ncbi:phosphatase [Velocimicrobium porci]|uniref:Phosphatase n=1 Tax=Velocimicrobium porci TaxID=2606634 RepID=A0A6L5XU28_9FIRM|nr:phosphatase [Velocimicrobium porci]MSS62286.1 phosphatase [Velocimicrobium porci]